MDENSTAGMHRWDCGCLTGTVGTTFVIEPCSLTCKLYLMVMQESRALGNRETILDMR